VLALVVVAVDVRPERRGDRVAGVEHGAQAEHGPLGGRVAAQHAQPRDAHRPGLGDAHRAPDPARVPLGVQAVPVLEHARQVSLAGEVRLARARHLHREQVLAALAQRVGDLERVGHEVALGVADVPAVEPHVALVEEPVEDEPAAPAVARRRRLEPAPVQQRAVVLGERR
jgi:hypothetical protein